MFTIWQTAAGREGLLRVDFCLSRPATPDPQLPVATGKNRPGAVAGSTTSQTTTQYWKRRLLARDSGLNGKLKG